MRFANFYGNSLNLTPTQVSITESDVGITSTIDNKVFIFSDISKFVVDDLYSIITEDELRTNYSTELLGVCDGISLKYTYDVYKKERVIIKDPVDAIPYISTNTGTAAWVAIKVKDGEQDFFIFTDNIGSYPDVSNFVTLNKTNITADIQYYVNNISIITRDRCKREIDLGV